MHTPRYRTEQVQEWIQKHQMGEVTTLDAKKALAKVLKEHLHQTQEPYDMWVPFACIKYLIEQEIMDFDSIEQETYDMMNPMQLSIGADTLVYMLSLNTNENQIHRLKRFLRKTISDDSMLTKECIESIPTTRMQEMLDNDTIPIKLLLQSPAAKAFVQAQVWTLEKCNSWNISEYVDIHNALKSWESPLPMIGLLVTAEGDSHHIIKSINRLRRITNETPIARYVHEGIMMINDICQHMMHDAWFTEDFAISPELRQRWNVVKTLAGIDHAQTTADVFQKIIPAIDMLYGQHTNIPTALEIPSEWVTPNIQA